MRTKSAFKNISSSLILQLVVAISGIILPGLIIREYGSEANGLVSLLRQSFAYFSVVSLGFGAASSVALYNPLSKRNYDEINSILSATRLFFNKTGYIFALIVSIMTLVIPIYLTSTFSYQFVASVIFIIGLGAISEYILVSKYRILLVADQKNNVVSKITAQGIVLNTVSSMILIYLNAPLLLVLISSTVIYIVRLVYTKKFVREEYDQIDYFAPHDSAAIKGKWNAILYHLPNMFINYTPIIVVSTSLGLISASIYAIYNMIFQAITMLVSVFSAGFNASFGNVMAEGKNDVLLKSYDTYNYIFKTFLFSFYTTALILVLPFIQFYIGNSEGVNYIIPSIAISFAVSGMFKNIRLPAVTLVDAAGRFSENKSYNFIEALINIIFSIVFVKHFGITGVLISSAITGFVRSILFIIYTEKNILHRNWYKEIFYLSINFLLFLLLSFTFSSYINIYEVENILDWIIIAAPVSLIIFLIIAFTNSLMNYKAAKDVFKRINSLIN